MKVNHKVSVHAYKFNGCLYRTIEFPKIIYIDNKVVVLSLEKVRIISQSKNQKFYHFYANEASYLILFKDEWYNLFVTCAPLQNKTIFYFNVATPFIFEDETIKYIDLDLDVRGIFLDNKLKHIKKLDLHEFQQHCQSMLYPKKLINQSLKISSFLVDFIKNSDLFTKYNNDTLRQMMDNANKYVKKR